MSLIVALVLQFQTGLPADSIAAVRDAARRAEARFERLVRSLAPPYAGGSFGSDCDEIVGRFCLTYDEGPEPELRPERPEVTDARREAIEALRLAFSHEPGRLETTGPLVRYLVEDERAAEAVSAARTYAVLTQDSVWGPLLLGFALHAATEDSAAERYFDEGLSRLPEEERRQILDLEWILSSSDRDIYSESESGRESLERLFWRHADPLYLTPGNERRAEHIARHVWSRILSMTPRVREMLRWGDDLEQLTVRYGVPAARTRTWGTVYREGSLVDHFEPGQLAFAQPDLFELGPAPAPPPGIEWPLAAERSRSGYAPRTVRRLSELDHQITRFPLPDGRRVLRADGRLVLDSAASGAASVVAALYVRAVGDLETLGEVLDTVAAAGDTVHFALEADLPEEAGLYSFEVLEPGSRLAARARYAMDADSISGAFAVSDPLLARPWPADSAPAGRRDARLRPHARLIFEEGDDVGLYAEVTGLQAVAGERRYGVDLSIREADRASFPARAISWLGRVLGLSEERVPARVSWQAASPDGDRPAVVAVVLPLDDVSAGLWTLELAVTDQATGETVRSRRTLRIGER